MSQWWRDAVFYQVYPRSFCDSNGDGVGDLRGILHRLDYLKGLGVDALWISPFYRSPMQDFGYDISDYCDVDPLFGTLEDFRDLQKEAADRGIRIVVDLVVNHCSDQHPWFKAGRESKDAVEHDLFLWRPIERGLFGGKRRPNNWIAQFELSSAWWENDATDEWYLGTFTRNQPEFDFRSRELRRRVYEVMRFWLDLGVDGFRLDVANWYVKDESFRSNPLSTVAFPDLFQHHVYDRNQPGSHEVCAEMRRVAEEYGGDRVLIGEIYAQDPAIAASYHGHGDELHMAFNFDFLFRPWRAAEFRRSAERWYAELGEKDWPNFTLSNHDNPRHSQRYRGKTLKETDARMRVAAALLLTLRGTPFLYYGEEIGMRQSRLAKKDLRDPLGVKTWPLNFGRDGERTPMQWGPGKNAGFSDGRPWLPLPRDYEDLNVELQQGDPGSLLSWYKALISLRRATPALRSGTLRFLGPEEAPSLTYLREVSGERILVSMDFGGNGGSLPVDALPDAGAVGTVLLSSTREVGSRVPLDGTATLGPYEVSLLSLD